MTMTTSRSAMLRLAARRGARASSLGGCSALTRLSQIGATPPLTTIQNPKTQPGYQPVSMPMPQPIIAERRPNSLWQAGSRAFFKDQRASQVGDILTIDISFDDKAQFNNETQTQRTTAEKDGDQQPLRLRAADPEIPASCRQPGEPRQYQRLDQQRRQGGDQPRGAGDARGRGDRDAGAAERQSGGPGPPGDARQQRGARPADHRRAAASRTSPRSTRRRSTSSPRPASPMAAAAQLTNDQRRATASSCWISSRRSEIVLPASPADYSSRWVRSMRS